MSTRPTSPDFNTKKAQMIRSYYFGPDLDDLSNEELLFMTDGTGFAARVELYLAFEELKQDLEQIAVYRFLRKVVELVNIISRILMRIVTRVQRTQALKSTRDS